MTLSSNYSIRLLGKIDRLKILGITGLTLKITFN